MLWIIKGEMSHQIISCNVHFNSETKKYELWVARPNGKSLKLQESTNEEEVVIIKEAIDFAIEHKDNVLRLA